MEIQNGKYRGKARSTPPTLIESAQKGTPGIAVEINFTVEDRIESLTWTGWLSEAAYERTVDALRLLGWEGDDISSVTGLDKNEVELVIENEEYEGSYCPRIKFINRIGSGALGAAMSAEKAKAFASAFRDRVRAMEIAKGKPAAPAQRKPSSPANKGAPPEPPPHTDFDVPF